MRDDWGVTIDLTATESADPFYKAKAFRRRVNDSMYGGWYDGWNPPIDPIEDAIFSEGW